MPWQANDNKIPDLSDLQSQLSNLGELETVYLEGNPCQKAEGVNYRRKVMLALPQVKQIDATYGFSSLPPSICLLMLVEHSQAHE